MPAFVRVTSLSDLPPGTVAGFEVGDVNLCLANVDGAIYAFRDRCSHAEHPLSTGTLDGARVECSWHGAQFDVSSGRAVRLPAVKPVETYEAKIEGNDILVAV